jgi:hypothetical protein
MIHDESGANSLKFAGGYCFSCRALLPVRLGDALWAGRAMPRSSPNPTKSSDSFVNLCSAVDWRIRTARVGRLSATG